HYSLRPPTIRRSTAGANRKFSSPRSRSRLGWLRRLSGQEVCRILESYGFARVRQSGSHVVMQKRTAESTTSVPVPLHPELRRGTLQSIVRQSGIPRSEFELN